MKQSKSAFIRDQPATLAPREVVQKAKAAGIRVDAGLVSRVRWQAKNKRAKSEPRTNGVAHAATPQASSGTHDEHAFGAAFGHYIQSCVRAEVHRLLGRVAETK